MSFLSFFQVFNQIFPDSSQRSNLQSHKRATHYNDKRYKCNDCGKGFKRRRLLDYHIKAAHTGERPFKCSTCTATFVYPEHFKKHMRIHTGEKPYLCEVRRPQYLRQSFYRNFELEKKTPKYWKWKKILIFWGFFSSIPLNFSIYFAYSSHFLFILVINFEKKILFFHLPTIFIQFFIRSFELNFWYNFVEFFNLLQLLISFSVHFSRKFNFCQFFYLSTIFLQFFSNESTLILYSISVSYSIFNPFIHWIPIF